LPLSTAFAQPAPSRRAVAAGKDGRGGVIDRKALPTKKAVETAGHTNGVK
jgi:hypothetical protein